MTYTGITEKEYPHWSYHIQQRTEKLDIKYENIDFIELRTITESLF